MVVASKKHTAMVTGSSGYVASELIPLLSENFSIFGVDCLPSPLTDSVIDISSSDFQTVVRQMPDEGLTVVNLAAARFDFGAVAQDYYKSNVDCQTSFLNSLNDINVVKFIHVSSVAAFDGCSIDYSEELNCDDAYRSTKFLQEELIKNWCSNKGVDLVIVYPSAIFSQQPRSDTNIGKLQSISKFLPFIPLIDVVKSVTYLPNFSRFIIGALEDEIPPGKYLTIEKPSLTVSEMIQIISGRTIRFIRIPYFQLIMKIISNCLYVLGGFGTFDLKLMPNRVVKLFSDTSYSELQDDQIDKATYCARNSQELTDILGNFIRS